MSNRTTYKQTSIRLPNDYIDRAEDLLEDMAKDARYTAFGSLTRADVLRLAIQRGLDVLESEIEGQGEEKS